MTMLEQTKNKAAFTNRAKNMAHFVMYLKSLKTK